MAMSTIPSPFHATAEFALVFIVAMEAGYKSKQLQRIYHHIGFVGTSIVCLTMFIVGWISFKTYESTEHQFYLSWWYSLLGEGDLYTFPLRQITILMFVLVFVIIFSACLHRYNWFSRFGSLTLGLYPLNCIFVVVFKKVFDAENRYYSDSSLWWLVIAYMVSVLFFSIGTLQLLERFRFTRFCFLECK